MAAEQGLYDLDVQTGEAVVTPEYARMLGYDPAEFTETNERWIERLHPDDREAVAGAYRAYVAGETPEYRVEFRQRTKSGDWKWILSIGRIVQYDETGRPLRMLGTHTDITKRKEAEDGEVAADGTAAPRAEDGVGGKAGRRGGPRLQQHAAGHPRLHGAHQDAPPRGREARSTSLQEIERAALRARDVTRQLLAVSRKQIAAPRTLNLSEFLAETRTTLGRLIGEDVDLEVHLGADLWPVQIDPSQVDQVLMNLVVNARDAMPNGGKLTIETTNVRIEESYCRRHAGFREGDYVLLAVSDTGVGMDRETLAHVFEPFFTTKAVGKGTGLGLATVHGIVTQNGGVVSVHSEPGRGTTFRIYLPRMREPSAEAEATEEAAPGRTGGTVLLVEDDERRARDARRDAGRPRLRACSSRPGGSEALRLAGRADASIDVLLTDVVMPELSGKELSDRVRAIRPGLPVLYMSGYSADVIGHHGILDDGVHFIQKPFAMDDLARALRSARRVQAHRPAGG